MQPKSASLATGQIPDQDRILSPSVSRAVQVIERLSLGPSTLADLSSQLDIPKSTLHGIVSTLAAHGWIDINGRELRQGKRLFQAVIRYSHNELLKPTFTEIGHRIVGETGETTFLGVLEDREILHVARVDGTAPLRYVAQEGDHGPAHASALGKVLLAEKDPQEVGELFDPSISDTLFSHSPLDISRLIESLPDIKEQGYALDFGEVVDGLYCVAAPIRDASGKAIASIALAAPEFRFSDRQTQFIDIIRQSALEISIRLGYVAEISTSED
jgi:DNA-binding IclR family transcriptional regulator